VLPAPAHEARLVEQIARRITDERHLGKDDQVAALTAGPVDPIANLGRVPLEIPNEGIDLSYGYSHSRILSISGSP